MERIFSVSFQGRIRRFRSHHFLTREEFEAMVKSEFHLTRNNVTFYDANGDMCVFSPHWPNGMEVRQCRRLSAMRHWLPLLCISDT
jgi:hypothetical protein